MFSEYQKSGIVRYSNAYCVQIQKFAQQHAIFLLNNPRCIYPQISNRGRLLLRYLCIYLAMLEHYLDSVRDEAEYGTAPEKQRKSSKKSSTKLDPFRNRRSGCEAVEAILCVALGGCILGQARLQIGVEPLAKQGQIQ